MATSPPDPIAFPLPPVLQYPTTTPPTLITQGAEARLYKSTYLQPSLPCALKYRPPKAYRHPTLDARLTRQRILAEARILVKCRREGVSVPAVYAIDEAAGWMMLEWIDGAPVRVRINDRLGARIPTIPEDGDGEDGTAGEVLQTDEELKGLMRRMGTAVGKLHKIGVVHGDLTTSNMMLRPPWGDGRSNGEAPGALEGEIVVIDFGLATQGSADEDRAVDLYVLERAFGSTHPRAEKLFQEVLDGYRDTFKQAPAVLKKLEEVRMRGRKRSMVG